MFYTTVNPDTEEDWRNLVHEVQRTIDDVNVDYDEFVEFLPVSYDFPLANNAGYVQVALSSNALEEFRLNYGYARAGWKEQSSWL